VTETEWLTGTDPVALIAALGGRAPDRQFRLFAVAACYLCRKPGQQPKRKPRKRAIFESVDRHARRSARSLVRPARPERPFE
jgi:hypothetical protein